MDQLRAERPDMFIWPPGFAHENIRPFAGIDIVTIANNHILDYMLPGLQETQSVLEEAGVSHSGAGANSYEAYLPLFYSKSGGNIGISQSRIIGRRASEKVVKIFS